MFFKGLAAFIQLFINLIGFALGLLMKVLPTSPLQSMLSSSGFVGEFIGVCNYFIPVGAFVAVTQAWLLAVGLYYIHSAWQRWLKLID